MPRLKRITIYIYIKRYDNEIDINYKMYITKDNILNTQKKPFILNTLIYYN